MSTLEMIKKAVVERWNWRKNAGPILEEIRKAGRLVDIVSVLGSVFHRKEELVIRQFMADILAGEILEIADGANDNNPEEPGMREDVNRSKLRIDTRKWLMSNFSPLKYSDRPVAANEPGPSVFQAPKMYLPENGRD
jgi:Bacteriophage Sf6, terminase small subunit-like